MEVVVFIHECTTEEDRRGRRVENLRTARPDPHILRLWRFGFFCIFLLVFSSFWFRRFLFFFVRGRHDGLRCMEESRESQPRASSTAVGEIIDQGGPTTVVEHTPQAVSYSTVDSMAPRSVCSVGYPYFNNESYCTTSRRTFSDKARFCQR